MMLIRYKNELVFINFILSDAVRCISLSVLRLSP